MKLRYVYSLLLLTAAARLYAADPVQLDPVQITAKASEASLNPDA